MMYLYCETVEREILTPRAFKTVNEVKKQLFEDFMECTGIDDNELTSLINQGEFEEAYAYLENNDWIDDENDINLDDNNLSAYCETRNHDNWDVRVFKLETTEFSISIKP